MANTIVAKQSSFHVREPKFLSLARIIGNIGTRLRGRSRQEAQAEAIVNRFSCDRWSDAIEREISIRVR
jgi:hypothetical protein